MLPWIAVYRASSEVDPVGDLPYDFVPPTSRIGRVPSQFIAACLTRSKNGPLVPLMSEISITVPGWAWVSK
ncbi:hypothetical protein ACVWWK_008163 [Bradyrhizobium sp. LB9.1b]